MLVTFKSKAAAEVLMYEEHAKRILGLLDKDVRQGIITADEAPHAIEKLEAEIAVNKLHPHSEVVQRDVLAHQGNDGDDNEHEHAEFVSFATRAYPLLEMLRAANREHCNVVWGV